MLDADGVVAERLGEWSHRQEVVSQFETGLTRRVLIPDAPIERTGEKNDSLPSQEGPPAMVTSNCPRDNHGLIYNDATKGLICGDKNCHCPECHRMLTEAERKDWARE